MAERGKIYDFPPRGKIYLRPFFCLKRCYGLLKAHLGEPFREIVIVFPRRLKNCPKNLSRLVLGDNLQRFK